jgi:hypothetical protein
MAADIFAIGAMLREAVCQAGPDERWNSSLDAVIERACAHAPDQRWPAASAMAMALRSASGPLPTPVHVSAFMRDAFSGRVRARRASLESQTARPLVLAEVVASRPSVPPKHRSAAQPANLRDEPKVQIAPAVLDPPTLRRLPVDASATTPESADVSRAALLKDDIYRRRLPTIRISDARRSMWHRPNVRAGAMAIAILVAFAIGCFLGGWAWFRSARPKAAPAPTSTLVPKSP